MSRKVEVRPSDIAALVHPDMVIAGSGLRPAAVGRAACVRSYEDFAAGIEAVEFIESDRADRQVELLEHLQANVAHYGQAMFAALDTATIVGLLAAVAIPSAAAPAICSGWGAPTVRKSCVLRMPEVMAAGAMQ